MTGSREDNERHRLATLAALRIVDSEPEEAFDRITRTVAAVLGAPVALISVVDDTRQWFKSCHGLDVRETPREHSFCAHAIEDDAILVVRDAREDERFKRNPFVAGAPFVRFYAGAPLTTSSGHRLGTLCVFAPEPRLPTDDQLETLGNLAAVVVELMESRVARLSLAAEIGRREEAERSLADSEHRFRRYAGVAGEWFWEMDGSLRFTHLSPRVEEIIGLPIDSAIGKTRQEIADEQASTEKWLRHLKTLERREPFTDFRYGRRDHDGRVQHLSVSGVPRFDENGEFLGYAGIGKDITAQVDSEYEAALATERLAAAVDTLSDAFCLWDRDDRLVLANEKYLELNEPVRDAVTPGIRYLDHVNALLDAGLIPESEGDRRGWLRRRLKQRRNPGPPFELERQAGIMLLVHEQKLPDGGLATIATDITELHQAKRSQQISESRFRGLAEGAILGIVIDRDGKPLFANIAYANLFGFDRVEDILALDVLDGLYHRQERERIADYRMARLRGGDPPTRYEFLGIRRDGKEVWLEGQFRVVDWDGAPATQSTVIDITARKQIEAELIESRQRYKEYAEDSSDWHWETGPDHRLVYLSEQFEKKTGAPLATMLGKTRLELAGDVDPNREPWKSYLRMLERREPFSRFEYSYKLPNEDVRYAQITGRPKFDADGEFAGYRGTATDITELKETEQTLIRALEQADRANQAKNEFLSSMSHELRTPLNAVLGFAQLLDLSGEQSPLTEDQRVHVKQIVSSGSHLLSLIDDLLDLSSIESGRLRTNIERVDLEAAVGESLQMIAGLAEEREVQLMDTRIGPGAGFVHADRTRLVQALTNILSNAVKYNRPNGSVQVMASPTKARRVRISITDTGRGIPEDRGHELFQPFARLGQEAGPEPGSGIGLALTKRLVDSMAGVCGVDNWSGVGCTFWIELPLAAMPRQLSKKELESTSRA